MYSILTLSMTCLRTHCSLGGFHERFAGMFSLLNIYNPRFWARNWSHVPCVEYYLLDECDDGGNDGRIRNRILIPWLRPISFIKTIYTHCQEHLSMWYDIEKCMYNNLYIHLGLIYESLLPFSSTQWDDIDGYQRVLTAKHKQ